MTDHPARKPHPSRLTVEVTTRCNMRCAMCVKQTPGNDVGDVDMSLSTFGGLAPLFPYLESLVLTGVGEPLLHPRLTEFVARARAAMPQQGSIGFQTNGRLLDERRAAALRDAGVDRVCVSVDSTAPDTFRSLRAGGELAEVERSFAALSCAAKGGGIAAGAETVVTRDTVRHLPEMVRWAAARGVRFLLVSHMLPYAEGAAEQAAHPSFTDAALELYAQYARRAREQGLDPDAYLDVLWRFDKSSKERRLVALAREMLEQARQRGAWIRPQRLLGHDAQALDRLREAFDGARRAARDEGVELHLPAALPRFDRRCAFVEEGRAFVDVSGRVAPCYFLWHRYVCHLDGRRKPVAPVRYAPNGSGVAGAWNDPAFVAFREAVLRYDYPYCLDCAMTPCDLIEAETFEMDCYGREVPCGDCPWALGLYHCLG